MKSIIASLVFASFIFVVGCGSNAPNNDYNTCPTPPGMSCGNLVSGSVANCQINEREMFPVVCCGGTWGRGTVCPSTPAPAPTPSNPVTGCAPIGAICNGEGVTCGGNTCCSGKWAGGQCSTGVTKTPGPSPTQPPADGTETWCGKDFRTIRVTWPGNPANGYVAQRFCMASPALAGSGSTSAEPTMVAWPSQTPAPNLDTWLSTGQDVAFSTATYVEDVKVCKQHALVIQCYDVYTANGQWSYGVLSNEVKATFTENGTQKNCRLVQNYNHAGVNCALDP